MKNIRLKISELEKRAVIDFLKYKKEHPATKKSPSDEMFKPNVLDFKKNKKESPLTDDIPSDPKSQTKSLKEHQDLANYHREKTYEYLDKNEDEKTFKHLHQELFHRNQVEFHPDQPVEHHIKKIKENSEFLSEVKDPDYKRITPDAKVSLIKNLESKIKKHQEMANAKKNKLASSTL